MPDSILVVDDSRVSRRLLHGILSREGFEVQEAASGRDGIAMASAEPPGLILLDIDMPEIDGFEVCGALKGNPSTSEVPIVFLSSLDQAVQKVRGLELGAADYVTKPFDRAEVLARVKTQLRLSGLTRSLRAVNRELVRQRESLDEDLHAAAEIQRSLLPTMDRKRGPLEMTWRYMPCTSIGGDIFNVLELTDEETALYVADVAGHGVPSALVSISISHRLTGPLASGSGGGRRPRRDARAVEGSGAPRSRVPDRTLQSILHDQLSGPQHDQRSLTLLERRAPATAGGARRRHGSTDWTLAVRSSGWREALELRRGREPDSPPASGSSSTPTGSPRRPTARGTCSEVGPSKRRFVATRRTSGRGRLRAAR